MTNAEHAALYSAMLHFIRVTRGLPMRVVRKRSSVLMWIIAGILFPFNRRFMDGFITTIAGRMYIPDGMTTYSLWRVAAHEGLHVQQDKRAGRVRFACAYLFPAPLALLALGAFGAFWTPWAWCSLLALLALAPWPSPWRVRYEREAYLVTAVCDAMTGQDIMSPRYLDFMVEYHCGWNYYRPAWNRAELKRRVLGDLTVARRIADGHDVPGFDYACGVAKVVRARMQETSNA